MKIQISNALMEWNLQTILSLIFIAKIEFCIPTTQQKKY